MARKDDERLNELLQEWRNRADRQVDREALRQRIHRAVEGVRPMPDCDRRADWAGRRAVRARLAAATVAAILLLVLVWQVRTRTVFPPPTAGTDSAAQLLAQLDAGELERRLALLDQLDELFADRWEWMVECGDRVEMHVSSKSGRAVSSGQVAVRLAVLVRDDPSETFRVQEKTFVLTREEQPVEAVLEDGVSRKLYFWAFPIDENLFTYDVDFQTTKPEQMSIASSGVVVPGRPTKILSFEQAGSEYRAYLLLVPVSEKTGGARRL